MEVNHMKVDRNTTQEYYRSIDPVSLCDCTYCKNYRSQIKTAYPEVANYLHRLGIDITKPFEISPLEPDEKGILEYCCCQYVVFGTCKSTYHHQIKDVTFRMATSYPSTGIKKEHFLLEFFPIQLKLEP